MKNSRWRVLPGLVVVGAISAWGWTQYDGTETVQYRAASTARGDLQATVSASNAVNPGTQVSVGTQVSGQIRDPLVDFKQDANGLAAQRARLVDALRLDNGQQAKLDAITADMRPRLVSRVDMDEVSRQSARQKLLTNMRLKINEMLTPDQRATYELMQARAEAGRTAQTSVARHGADPATALVAPSGEAAR